MTAPGYLTLDEALAAGLASVTEVSETGSVPELLVKNGAAKPVLSLDSEELVGAKQNRIVNLTILVAAQQTLHIPVSCVEAGRWARRSREFAAAAMYERSRSKLDAFLEKLEPVPRQAGAVFTINGIVAGLDVFDSPATWRKPMRTLVQSFGLRALDNAGGPMRWGWSSAHASTRGVPNVNSCIACALQNSGL